VKLDELIRVGDAERTVLDIEEMNEEDVEWFKKRYERLAESDPKRAGGDEKAPAKPRRKPSA
jgi:low affinity Fe/Cu permease